MKRIIYKNPDNTVSIIVPSDEALQSMTIEQIAKKDVPTGLKYKIVDVSEIPSDREFRNAWTIDEAELTDGVGEDITIDDINKENGVGE
jgi:predicted acetyltransferase